MEKERKHVVFSVRYNVIFFTDNHISDRFILSKIWR